MTKKIEKPKVFSTRDLYLAATLITLKFYMVGIDFQIEGEKNQPVGYFSFDDIPLLREAEKKYWQGLLVVEPRSFTMNQRSLKAQVTNIYKNPQLDTTRFDK